ncbi:MAG TPA: DUF2238 domain-containing protein [Lysobacter sp.]
MNAFASAEPVTRAASPLRHAAIAATAAIFFASWIRPIWPLEQALHGSLTVVALVLLFAYARRRDTRDGDVLLLCAFLVLHCIASRWLYSNVPCDAWCQRLLEFSPQAAFGWERNHFDRLVHLAYGLCFAPALVHGLRLRYRLGAGHAFALMLLLVMGSSLAYEWLEWGIALALAPEQAEAYNGQQGDPWDAHADMLLATLGAAAWAPRLMREPATDTAR